MKKILYSLSFLALLWSNYTLAQTETSGRATLYRATETKVTELKHTKLKVNFDFDKEQLYGEAWITASPYFYAQNQLVLDAKAMVIHEVALEKNTAKIPTKFVYKNDVLTIDLDKTYDRNQNYTIYIKYTARPNEVKQQGSAAISDAKGLYFINAHGKDPDKPTQIWTQGETESSSAWFPTIDNPSQKTTQEIYMKVPDRFVTLSNGFLKSSTKEANGLRTDYWVMEKKHAPYLFFMGVGDYAVIKDKWRNIPVDYYVEKEYETVAKQIFGNTPEMMEFFSKKLNYDFPWNKYAQITGRDYVSGAMENTTAVIHGESAQQKAGDLVDENKWEDVIAHELFHHWFGDLVTTESWSNITVNESFANYSEYLWNEFKYGKDMADYGLMKANQGYFMDPSNIKKDLVRFDYHAREDVFDGVSYNKGGAILHMLRKYLGDDAFFAGLSHYLHTYEYGTGEAHQVRLSLEKISGKDLNWFFNQWYFGSGHPKLSSNFSYDPVKKEVTVSVNQSQSDYFEFPMAIDIYESGKPVRQNVWVSAKSKNVYTFPCTKNPDFININPDGIVLSEVVDKKTPQQLYTQYMESKEFHSRYQALNQTSENLNDDFAIKTLLAAFKDSNFRIRAKALESLDLTKPDQAKITLAEVEKLAVNDPKTLVQSAAITALSKINNPKYSGLFEKGISSNSNAVKSASFAGLVKIDTNKALPYADQIDISNASEELMNILLPVIVKNKITSQMPAIGSTVAFYPFIKMQNPALGNFAEEGFNWIMTSDNTKATKSITKILTDAKGQLSDNPQAKMMILNILKEGVAKKMQLLKNDPKSTSINTQIDLINKVIESYR